MQLYKPNSFNKGHGISFSHNSKDGAVYIQVIKQTSWNPQTKKGEFKGGLKFNLKINSNEMSQIISSIETNTPSKFFHTSDKGSVSFEFKPYVKEGVQNGFTLSINPSNQDPNNKLSFGFWFTSGESVLVREYFKWSLKRIFDAAYALAKKSFEDKQNAAKIQANNPTPKVEVIPQDPAVPEPNPDDELVNGAVIDSDENPFSSIKF